MNYIEFYNRWKESGCFNLNQIYAWQPDFNRTNLNSWIKKGLVVKLRNEWYAFSEMLKVPDFAQYIANRIYNPSYISLQTALSHYGIIPEGVVQITSVTSLKPKSFINNFGEFFYQNVKPKLMFGYMPKLMKDGRAILYATPEKALLDYLYLNPYYASEEDMLQLRLDEDFMQEDFDKELFMEYNSKIGSKALTNRIQTLFKSYEL